jgi:hypothetical protein
VKAVTEDDSNNTSNSGPKDLRMIHLPRTPVWQFDRNIIIRVSIAVNRPPRENASFLWKK